MKIATALTLVILVSGCSGVVKINPPGDYPKGSNTKTIPKSRDAVWNAAVPALGKQFFVINNLDKSSGLINLSYSGDPERYVDCGTFTSTVSNARGERHYSFPGARESASYEVMNNAGLSMIRRTMKLEGRVNLIFEEVSPTVTRVTANTRYVVTRIAEVNSTQGGSRTFNDSISFNSGARQSFSKTSDGQAVECTSTGALEFEILSIIN